MEHKHDFSGVFFVCSEGCEGAGGSSHFLFERILSEFFLIGRGGACNLHFLFYYSFVRKC